MIFLSGFMMALGLLLLSLPAPRSSPRGMAGASVLAALVFVAGSLGSLETRGRTGGARRPGREMVLAPPAPQARRAWRPPPPHQQRP